MVQAIKTPKKVLFLITKATHGGAQRYVLDLATHMPADITPVLAYGTPGKLSEELSHAGITVAQIPALDRDVSLTADIRSFFEILTHLRATRPDVLHLNSSKAAALGALAGRLAGVPRIVFTAHGWPFKEPRGRAASFAIYLISWFSALLSHAVIVMSKEDERYAHGMLGIRKKTSRIPLAIDVPTFLSREEALNALNLSGVSPQVGTIAELTRNKGIRYAIEAIAILKSRGVDCSYTIIGDGEEKGALTALTKDLGVEDRVTFSGFVPSASKYLKAFDVFVLPSLKEGMPYVILEARAAGLPLVTTNVVDMLGAVAPGDAKALANAIAETLTHKTPHTSAETSSLAEMLERTLARY